MPENRVDDRLRKFGIGIGGAALVLGVAVFLIVPVFLLGEKYKDDTSIYAYRILISSAYFDPAEKAHPAYGAFLHKEIRTFYANAYLVSERELKEHPKEACGSFVANHPITVTVQEPREFQKDKDGYYYYLVPWHRLVLQNLGSAQKGQMSVSYEPDENLDITVIRQADNKIAFSSTKWLDDFRRRKMSGR